MTETIEALLAAGLREVSLARTQAWTLLDGADADAQLAALERSLAAIRDNPQGSRQGLARWVIDWIPDVNHPLVAIVSRLEHFAP